MLINEFEKQMKKQMEDLQLNPSASVWQKVEGEIKRKKRRRMVVFYLLPLATALLGVSVYLFVSKPGKTDLAKHSTATEKSVAKDNKPSPAESKSPSAGNPSATPDQSSGAEPATTPGANNDAPVKEDLTQKQKPVIVDKNNDLQISSVDPAVSPLKQKKNTPQKNQPAIVQKKTNPSPLIKNKLNDKSDLIVTVEDPTTGKIVKNDKNNIVKNDKDNNTNTDPAANWKKDDVAVKAKVDDPAIKNDVPGKADSSKIEEAIAQIENKKNPKKQRKSKSNWGVDFAGGMTSSSDATLSLNSVLRASDNIYYSPSALSGGTANFAYALNTASAVKSGPAFRLGVVTEMEVSKKIRVSAGLRYAYASNQIKVGTRADTAVRLREINNGVLTDKNVEEAYVGEQKENHTNRYHFVQLPVGFHWQINKGKKIPPIQLNIGVSLDYLLGSNALLYDPGYNGIYYHNKDALNKTHVNAGTGISVRLQTKSGNEWVLGPEMTIDMSRIIKYGYDEVQYLLYGGVNAKLFFHKKKK